MQEIRTIDVILDYHPVILKNTDDYIPEQKLILLNNSEEEGRSLWIDSDNKLIEAEILDPTILRYIKSVYETNNIAIKHIKHLTTSPCILGGDVMDNKIHGYEIGFIIYENTLEKLKKDMKCKR